MNGSITRLGGLTLALALALVACGGGEDARPADEPTSAAAPAPAGAPDLIVGEWRLVAIDMSDGEDVMPVADAVPTLSFSAEATPTGSRTMTGFGGCNRLTGSYDAGTTGRFSLPQPPAMTRMACPDDRMRVESVLGMALESARTYSVEDDRLEIGFGGGTIRMERVPEADGEG
jgi:heat shock protein HslJ